MSNPNRDAASTSAVSVGSPIAGPSPSARQVRVVAQGAPDQQQRQRAVDGRPGAPDADRAGLPGGSATTAVIRFSVSVPVLSLQMTVTAPSVSTAVSLRMSALRRSMRRAPSASAMVTTAGSPSGTAATARLTAVTKTSVRLLAAGDTEDGQRGDQHERQHRQPPAERVEPSLQRRRLPLDHADEGRDPPQLGAHPRAR